MKHLATLLLLLLWPGLAGAQENELTLAACYRLAQQHYPLLQQQALIEQSHHYSIENAARGHLPQVSFSGQASYQSEVTRLPLDLPHMPIEAPAKDQYRVVAEVNQSLYGGGLIRQQQAVLAAQAQVEQQKVTVELYNLRQRLHQLFFGILLLEKQLQLADLLKSNISLGLERVQAQVANGAALKSQAQVLQADLLLAGQRRRELQETRRAYLAMLAQFINQPLTEQTVLVRPASPALTDSISRPELRLYDFQRNALLVQEKLIGAKNRPRLSLFVQGGYGRPGLNLLQNQFDFYYLTGLRFNWTFSGLYTARNERQLLAVSRSLVDVQQETFLFNTRLALRQQAADVQQLQQTLATDEEIIALRAAILQAARAQLANGAITARDYLREVNAEDQARQNLLLHQVQLLLAQYQHQNLAGHHALTR